MRTPLPNDGAAFRCTFVNSTKIQCTLIAVTLVSPEDVATLAEYGWAGQRAMCEVHATLAEDR